MIGGRDRNRDVIPRPWHCQIRNHVSGQLRHQAGFQGAPVLHQHVDEGRVPGFCPDLHQQVGPVAAQGLAHEAAVENPRLPVRQQPRDLLGKMIVQQCR